MSSDDDSGFGTIASAISTILRASITTPTMPPQVDGEANKRPRASSEDITQVIDQIDERKKNRIDAIESSQDPQIIVALPSLKELRPLSLTKGLPKLFNGQKVSKGELARVEKKVVVVPRLLGRQMTKAFVNLVADREKFASYASAEYTPGAIRLSEPVEVIEEDDSSDLLSDSYSAGISRRSGSLARQNLTAIVPASTAVVDEPRNSTGGLVSRDISKTVVASVPFAQSFSGSDGERSKHTNRTHIEQPWPFVKMSLQNYTPISAPQQKQQIQQGSQVQHPVDVQNIAARKSFEQQLQSQLQFQSDVYREKHLQQARLNYQAKRPGPLVEIEHQYMSQMLSPKQITSLQYNATRPNNSVEPVLQTAHLEYQKQEQYQQQYKRRYQRHQQNHNQKHQHQLHQSALAHIRSDGAADQQVDEAPLTLPQAVNETQDVEHVGSDDSPKYQLPLADNLFTSSSEHYPAPEHYRMAPRPPPPAHYGNENEKKSKGLTFHLGGGPVGGGSQLITSPIGIFRQLMLPLLPSPRANLNGKIVFGVVLEKTTESNHPLRRKKPWKLFG